MKNALAPYNAQMNESSALSSTPSFTNLTPDCVLDALESVGLYSDGRLLALNSYENRVYQIGIEDGPPLVAKFTQQSAIMYYAFFAIGFLTATVVMVGSGGKKGGNAKPPRNG